MPVSPSSRKRNIRVYRRVRLPGRPSLGPGPCTGFFKNDDGIYKALVLEQAEKFHKGLRRAIDSPGDEID